MIWKTPRFVSPALLLLAFAAAASPQAMPASLLGRWRIERVLPTHNVACWDEARARTLLGTSLRFEPGRLRGAAGETTVTETLSRTLSRRKFQEEYKVDLPELTVRAETVTELDLQHEDADYTGATTEVPGDTVVLAGPGRIVVSACGVFYLAVRVPR